VVEGDDGDEIWVRAVALSPDGSLFVRRSASGRLADAVQVANGLAAEMIADGASDLMVLPLDPAPSTAPATTRQQL
jgi:hydroxymethylbilane synthase